MTCERMRENDKNKLLDEKSSTSVFPFPQGNGQGLNGLREGSMFSSNIKEAPEELIVITCI